MARRMRIGFNLDQYQWRIDVDTAQGLNNGAEDWYPIEKVGEYTTRQLNTSGTYTISSWEWKRPWVTGSENARSGFLHNWTGGCRYTGKLVIHGGGHGNWQNPVGSEILNTDAPYFFEESAGSDHAFGTDASNNSDSVLVGGKKHWMYRPDGSQNWEGMADGADATNADKIPSTTPRIGEHYADKRPVAAHTYRTLFGVPPGVMSDGIGRMIRAGFYGPYYQDMTALCPPEKQFLTGSGVKTTDGFRMDGSGTWDFEHDLVWPNMDLGPYSPTIEDQNNTQHPVDYKIYTALNCYAGSSGPARISGSVFDPVTGLYTPFLTDWPDTIIPPRCRMPSHQTGQCSLTDGIRNWIVLVVPAARIDSTGNPKIVVIDLNNPNGDGGYPVYNPPISGDDNFERIDTGGGFVHATDQDKYYLQNSVGSLWRLTPGASPESAFTVERLRYYAINPTPIASTDQTYTGNNFGVYGKMQFFPEYYCIVWLNHWLEPMWCWPTQRL